MDNNEKPNGAAVFMWLIIVMMLCGILHVLAQIRDLLQVKL